MTPTLEEIALHQARVRAEIMRGECILATLDVIAKHMANGRAPSSFDLEVLLPGFSASARTHELKEISPPAPVALLPTPPSPAERYIHPELEATGHAHGSYTKMVRWAIGQMTRDYSLYHISALLAREGRTLSSAHISVVLSRLKSRGEIEEVRAAQGPIPALFRRPEIELPADFQPLDSDLKLSFGCEEKLRKAEEHALIEQRLHAAGEERMLPASSPSQ